MRHFAFLLLYRLMPVHLVGIFAQYRKKCNRENAIDQELPGTQERIADIERLLDRLRATATPEEFRMMAGGYRAELERMQAEVVRYLTRPLERQDQLAAR